MLHENFPDKKLKQIKDLKPGDYVFMLKTYGFV
jgi:hypothetical protein